LLALAWCVSLRSGRNAISTVNGICVGAQAPNLSPPVDRAYWTKVSLDRHCEETEEYTNGDRDFTAFIISD